MSLLAEHGNVTAAWLRYGVWNGDDAREETPEDAVSEPELEGELERIVGIVRLVGGKEGFTDDQRRALKRDILNTYIDAFKADGIDPRELYVMLGKVDRGEL